MTDEADQQDADHAIERRESHLESPHANQIDVGIQSIPVEDVDGVPRMVCFPTVIDKEFHKKWFLAPESAFVELEEMR